MRRLTLRRLPAYSLSTRRPWGLRRSLLALILLIACGACRPKEEPLTREEAQAALVAVQLSNEAYALTYDVVDVTTGFTLGQAAANAAENMRDFVKSQIPCATAELTDDKVLGIDFGVRGDDSCTWRGKTYTGRVEVQVDKVADGEVAVTHSWIDLSDGRITVNGGATVDWNFNAVSRRVAHSLSWQAEEGDGEATGDRTQTLLEGGGFQIDGTRTWSGVEGKQWALQIDGVQVRAQDPVPQAGTYTLSAPGGQTLTLGFVRIDATTIEVTIGNGRKDFSFNVKARQ